MPQTPDSKVRYLHVCNLIYAGDLATLKPIFDGGFQAPESSPPLLYTASSAGHPGVIRLLLDRGDDVDSRNLWQGITCLMIAANSGRIDAVRLLLDSGADPSLRDESGKTLHDHARENSNRHTREPMLHFLGERLGEEEADRDGERVAALVAAVRSRNRPADEIVAELREAGGLDRILRPKEGGDAALDLAVRGGDVELAKRLLEEGANPESNSRTIPGPEESPLMQAAYLGNREMIELLLEHGANVNAVNPWSQTPLHYAMNGAVEGDSAEPVATVLLLLARGGDPHAQAGPEEDAEPRRALDYAIQGRETIRQAAASQQGGDGYFAPRIAVLTEMIDLLRAAM
ncbi:MAG TPA: ankyrin repeat domain-containing protein [Armatimonadaceae bacterium]|nr:ankyrin repeat domain-containing protein [Armatimonadaceae bacterium]